MYAQTVTVHTKILKQEAYVLKELAFVFSRFQTHKNRFMVLTGKIVHKKAVTLRPQHFLFGVGAAMST